MKYEEFIIFFNNHHKGHRHTITRRELAMHTRLNDRDNRAYIEQAWRDGYFIINNNDGWGYFLVDFNDPADVGMFIKYISVEERRKKTIEEKLSIGYKQLGGVVSEGV